MAVLVSVCSSAHLQVVLGVEHGGVHRPDGPPQHHHACVPDMCYVSRTTSRDLVAPQLHELLKRLPCLSFLVPKDRQAITHIAVVVNLVR
eukprot:765498-Hanusia_phi.AAC.5